MQMVMVLIRNAGFDTNKYRIVIYIYDAAYELQLNLK